MKVIVIIFSILIIIIPISSSAYNLFIAPRASNITTVSQLHTITRLLIAQAKDGFCMKEEEVNQYFSLLESYFSSFSQVKADLSNDNLLKVSATTFYRGIPIPADMTFKTTIVDLKPQIKILGGSIFLIFPIPQNFIDKLENRINSRLGKAFEKNELKVESFSIIKKEFCFKGMISPNLLDPTRLNPKLDKALL